LLLPQVGGSARKTNTDYTNGQLPELIDIIIGKFFDFLIFGFLIFF